MRTDLADAIGDVIEAPAADVHVPSLCDIEIAAGLRRLALHGSITEERIIQAVQDYLDLPITRHGHQRLLGRILALRENLSPYDATYVALAEQLSGELLTADAGLARAAQAQTDVGIAHVPPAGQPGTSR